MVAKYMENLIAGETAVIQGVLVRGVSGIIGPGDLYVVDYTSGPKLLNCKSVVNDKHIISENQGYAIDDIWACVRVEKV